MLAWPPKTQHVDFVPAGIVNATRPSGRYKSFASKRRCMLTKGKGDAGYHVLGFWHAVHVWGKGDLGQLGIGHVVPGCGPVVLPPFSADQLVHIACGELHTAFLTANGQVFTSGSNRAGQLGVSGFMSSPAPVQVAALDMCSIRHVACGRDHSAAVTGTGSLVVWGAVEGEEEVSRPRAVVGALPLKHRFMQVACGATHTLAVTESGQVFSFGSNSYGALGLGSQLRSPTARLILEFSSTNVLQVACGEQHSTALTSEGAVYSWGRGTYGALGLNETANKSLPQYVHMGGVRVTRLACGGDHTLAITTDGSLFTWGRGDWGQTGHGSREDTLRPLQVQALRSDHVLQVAAGKKHSIAYVSSGAVYGWGDNEHWQLGCSAGRTVLEPTIIEGLPKGRLVVLEAGGDHSALVFEGEGSSVIRPQPRSLIPAALGEPFHKGTAGKSFGAVWPLPTGDEEAQCRLSLDTACNTGKHKSTGLSIAWDPKEFAGASPPATPLSGPSPVRSPKTLQEFMAKYPRPNSPPGFQGGPPRELPLLSLGGAVPPPTPGREQTSSVAADAADAAEGGLLMDRAGNRVAASYMQRQQLLWFWWLCSQTQPWAPPHAALFPMHGMGGIPHEDSNKQSHPAQGRPDMGGVQNSFGGFLQPADLVLGSGSAVEGGAMPMGERANAGGGLGERQGLDEDGTPILGGTFGAQGESEGRSGGGNWRKREREDERGDVEGGRRLRRPLASETPKVCSNCNTRATPFWRKDRQGGAPLCNACGLYFAKNDAHRPRMLWKRGEEG